MVNASVVIVSTGEYDTYDEWVLCVFSTRERAVEFMEEAESWILEEPLTIPYKSRKTLLEEREKWVDRFNIAKYGQFFDRFRIEEHEVRQ